MIQKIVYQNYTINVQIEGSGKPIILLHGWPTNANLWKAQREFLREQYQVISPDWLGFGNSDKPEDHHYSFQEMKNALDAIIGSLIPPNERLTVVAHDIGGPAALLWANENQKRVQSLVMLNTLFYDFFTPLDKLGHFVFGLPVINRLQLSDLGLSGLMMYLLKNKHENVLRAACEILNSQDTWSHKIRRKTIMEPRDRRVGGETNQLAAIFRELQVEKHLIIADKDPLCYAHMRRIHEENPDVAAYFLKGCGHYSPLERPEELNEILGQILEDNLEVISYLHELSPYVKQLNYEWLEKFFRIEEGDKVVLSNPKEEIIDNGGFIFFARRKDVIEGTVALIRKNDSTYELGKMAVVPFAQGRGVGTRLLEHCIRFAEQHSIEKLILYSNTRLEAALHLFQKFGFRQTTLETGLYDRANIKMELKLNYTCKSLTEQD